MMSPGGHLMILFLNFLKKFHKSKGATIENDKKTRYFASHSCYY